jgi:hypothetical protein
VPGGSASSALLRWPGESAGGSVNAGAIGPDGRRGASVPFPEGVNAQTLQLDGSELFEFVGLAEGCGKPQQTITMIIKRGPGFEQCVELKSRIDTAIEVDYYRHGGILPFVLREIVSHN